MLCHVLRPSPVARRREGPTAAPSLITRCVASQCSRAQGFHGVRRAEARGRTRMVVARARGFLRNMEELREQPAGAERPTRSMQLNPTAASGARAVSTCVLVHPLVREFHTHYWTVREVALGMRRAVTTLEYTLPLEIAIYPHPCLRAENAKVGVFDETLQELTRAMFDIMYNTDGVGLAAPQVGVNVRLMVYNPEGCPKEVHPHPLVVPQEGFTFPVLVCEVSCPACEHASPTPSACAPLSPLSPHPWSHGVEASPAGTGGVATGAGGGVCAGEPHHHEAVQGHRRDERGAPNQLVPHCRPSLVVDSFLPSAGALPPPWAAEAAWR